MKRLSKFSEITINDARRTYTYDEVMKVLYTGNKGRLNAVFKHIKSTYPNGDYPNEMRERMIRYPYHCLLNYLELDHYKKQTKIYMFSQNISELPEALGELTRLKSLSLADNRLTKLSGKILSKLKNLRSLDLSRNQLTNIPTGLSKLNRLETLNISINKFNKLPNSIFKIESIETLYADENKIKEIPDEINQFLFLENLHVNDNMITHISESINDISSLKMLMVKRNPIINDFPPHLDRFRFFNGLDQNPRRSDTY